MGKRQALSKEIEELRKELHRLINGADSFNAGQILEMSMELDALINEYIRAYE